jgi:DNA mismatch endonuclease, patch repair protein
MNRSEIMSKVRSTNTSIELLMRKALWEKGLRYRKNDKNVFGKPDIVFKGKKIAIFCDSEFWHGKQFLETGKLPKNNREYWEKKIERNIARDILVNKTLQEDGWTVLRFWEKDIRKNLDGCVSKIYSEWLKKSYNS